MSHARVMPSKLDLTVRCPGSLQLQEQAAAKGGPTPDIRASRRNGAHGVALKHASGAGAEWPLGRKFVIGRHPLEVDDDMIDGAVVQG
jgi:hypothetical protein